jgi:hypothetical protein
MANDFTVADVLAWARTKPANEQYCYDDNGYCAIARFLKETGRAREPGVGSLTWVDWAEPPHISHPLSRELNRAVLARPWAFDALVSRLEAIIQEAPAEPSPWINPQTYINADCGEYAK